MSKTAAIHVGGFVELPGRLGLAKLLEVKAGIAAVKLFSSPTFSEIKAFTLSELSRGFIGPETRVYLNLEDSWQIGRVKDYLRRNDGFVEYLVRFQNGKERNICETHLDVRTWKSSGDPTAILAGRSAESQFLHDRRRAASERLISCHEKTLGLSALLSSSIDLVPYQVAAVRRILSDPIQRYLIADEVGMGKTVEAGVVIRQCLLDDVKNTAVVIVPDAIKAQWVDELRTKFRSTDFSGRLSVRSFSDFEGIDSPELLVVDEAHHVIGDPTLRSLAKSARRLLLLSATPVLGDELAFLSLLNLLDPTTNKVENVESFKKKAEASQDIGRLLLSLRDDASDFVLKRRIAEARIRFALDPIALQLSDALEKALLDPERKHFRTTCESLKFYIADTYRISHRVIRSRRCDAGLGYFQARSRKIAGSSGSRNSVTTEVDEYERNYDIAESIEDWRQQNRDGENTSAAITAFISIVEGTGISPRRALETVDVLATSNIPGLSDLKERLVSLVTSDSDASKIEIASQSLKLMRKSINALEQFPKIVAFVSDLPLANALFQRFNPNFTALCLSDNYDDLPRFEGDPRVWLLICDSSGEEGLNLHYAHGVLHVDLPFSASRIEQRIGRLDRFGRKSETFQQRVILPYDEEGSVWDAWFCLLRDGFKIFSEPISDVQFILDEIESKVWSSAFDRGALGIMEMIPIVSERIQTERLRQDEQAALDEIALSEFPIVNFMKGLEEVEDAEQHFANDMEGWLLNVMQLHRRPVSWPNQDAFFIDWTDRTVVPKVPWKSDLDFDLNRKLTWYRNLSLASKDVALLRPGSPLIDGSERYMRWDDRGSTFATWRIAPELDATDDFWLGFRLCFIVEPKLPDPERLQELNIDGIRRRAHNFLPPWSRTIDIDSLGNLVDDPRLQSCLSKNYSTKRSADGAFDINLGSRPLLWESAIDKDAFATLCLDLSRKAKTILLEDEKYNSRRYNALRSAQNERVRRSLSFGKREVFYGDADLLAATDFATDELLLESIANPNIRLDAIGFFVISRKVPGDFNEA